MDILQLVQQLESRRKQDPQAAIELIRIYEYVLAQSQPEANPAAYASFANDLANCYFDLKVGDPIDNLARAIACYQQCLRYLSPDTHGEDYTHIQDNMGNAYLALGDAYQYHSTGDRADNLTRAIGCYQQALRLWIPESLQREYVSTQIKLGDAFTDLPTGDHAANLAQAITFYQEALQRSGPETTAQEYKAIYIGLGWAYGDLPTGDRTSNLTQAISFYQQALSYYTPKAEPIKYAHIHRSIGTVYYQLASGDRTMNLSQAISHYQEALRFATSETTPLEYAGIQTNLGSAYAELPTGDHAANLARAITCYQEALRVATSETAPLEYAKIQTNLGVAYRDLRMGDHAANLARAITCYQEALRVVTFETAPAEYAGVQINLGVTYSEMLTGDDTSNLKRAIACYQEALRFWTSERAPAEYAMVQNNLGTVYNQLLEGDRTGNLEHAIACFQEALHVWTAETAPVKYAMTKCNLGNAYLELPSGNHADNTMTAVGCYQEALRIFTPEAFPFDNAKINNSLGDAYLVMLRFSTSDLAKTLVGGKAIGHFQEALRLRTPGAAPLEYADTQLSLGHVYSSLPLDEGEKNLTQAITYYGEALRYYTSEVAPLQYAAIQGSLGLTYSRLSLGDLAANQDRAIACYREALRFLRPETTPDGCRRTSSNLAELRFAREEWHEALDAYRIAMEAGERLYLAGLSTESKATEMAENAALYRNAAFSAVRCGEAIEAFLTLERGKTRLLIESLRLRVRRPANVPDEVWNAFESARNAIHRLQAEKVVPSITELDLTQAYMARERATQLASASLDAAIENVRTYAPHFLRKIDLPAIQSLLPDEHTALIAFCITEQGTIGFVMHQKQEQNIKVVEIPSFTRTDLRHHLYIPAPVRVTSTESIDQYPHKWGLAGWLVDYNDFLREPTSASFSTWQETITAALASLGRHLLSPILSTLPSTIERIILLPSSDLFLIPLHAAPLTETSSATVCDRFRVSYAPSVEVLVDIQTKAAQKVMPDLYAVINPQDDPQLIFALSEGKAIASFFTKRTVDQGKAGTKQRVVAQVPGRTYLHFSCHGSYNWQDPTESGLVLADGPLTLAALQRDEVDLSSARLVILSACETGITDIFQGSAEEYVGIPAGFLIAGVPCVISSLWAVSDLSTALLMERFYYNHLGLRMDFATALRDAQVWVRELKVGEVAEYAEQCYQQSFNDEEEKKELFRYMRYYSHQAEQNPAWRPFEHPYYWAAFTVNGM